MIVRLTERFIDRLPRGAQFVAVNALAILLLVAVVIDPLMAHFAERAEVMSDQAAQLARLQRLSRLAETATPESARNGAAYLRATDQQVALADLLATLKTLTTGAGARVVSMAAIKGAPVAGLTTVAASLDIEGSLASVRDTVQAIEDAVPLMFITTLSLRRPQSTDGGSDMQAELRVTAAMPPGSRATGPSTPNEPIEGLRP